MFRTGSCIGGLIGALVDGEFIITILHSRNVLFHSNPRVIDRCTFYRFLRTSFAIAFVQFVYDDSVFIVTLDGVWLVVFILKVYEIEFTIIPYSNLSRVSWQVTFFKGCCRIVHLPIATFQSLSAYGWCYICSIPCPIFASCSIIELQTVSIEWCYSSVLYTIENRYSEIAAFKVRVCFFSRVAPNGRNLRSVSYKMDDVVFLFVGIGKILLQLIRGVSFDISPIASHHMLQFCMICLESCHKHVFMHSYPFPLNVMPVFIYIVKGIILFSSVSY